jgi:membrane-bound ClpP family serine protease
MDIQELKPVMDMITEVKNDLIKKIDEVHTDVVETRDQAKKTNGRVTELEKIHIRDEAEKNARVIACGLKFSELTPSIPTIKVLNYITNKPLRSIVIFIGFIIAIQTLIMEAIDRQWFEYLIKLFM